MLTMREKKKRLKMENLVFSNEYYSDEQYSLDVKLLLIATFKFKKVCNADFL